MHIIHFDAHADLRDDYLGEKLFHATVMHRVWDIVGDNKIFQFGIRSGVSVGFVLRFINNFELKPKTKLAIEEAIKELNYEPNVYARGFKINKTNVYVDGLTYTFELKY